MGKNSGCTPTAILGLPKAPFVYISDPTKDAVHASGLIALLSKVVQLNVDGEGTTSAISTVASSDCLVVVCDSKNDQDNSKKLENARIVKQSALHHGANFVSVNIMFKSSEKSRKDDFGTNHLNIEDGFDVAKQIYEWLFTVLTVRETLHLMPEDQMKKVADKEYPEYEYCPVSEARNRPKNVQIKLAGLVASKPQITEPNRIGWALADRTGVVNFYFIHRGPESQYTWDFVLSLKPGDCKVLPRRALVQVKEKKRIRLLKSPFRATAMLFTLTGSAIMLTGRGICKIADIARLSPSSKWVDEEDIVSDSKKDSLNKVKVNRKEAVKSSEKDSANVSNEKDPKNWDDGASMANTEAGSDLDEKSGIEFM